MTRIRESSNVRKFAFFYQFFFTANSRFVWLLLCMRVVGRKLFQFLTNFNRQKFRVNEQTFLSSELIFRTILKGERRLFFYSRAVTTAVKWTMQISKSEQFYTLPIYKWQCTIWWFFATSCLPTQGEYGGSGDDERNRKFRVYSSSRARHILSSRWCIINWMTNCSPVLASRINLCVSIYLKQLQLVRCYK